MKAVVSKSLKHSKSYCVNLNGMALAPFTIKHSTIVLLLKNASLENRLGRFEMSEEKTSKDIQKNEKESDDKHVGRSCCYVVDPCGCYVDPCFCGPSVMCCQ